MTIQERLFELEDKEYGDFQQNLAPTISRDTIIGVRVPKVRNLAKEIVKSPEGMDFLHELPHKYYDENMLHAAMLTEVKDFEMAIKLVDEFLPFVDNWAVCDTMKPKTFKKHKAELIEKIKEWTKSSHTYTCRFGMEMLMNYFLDEDFKEEYLEIPGGVRSEEYYVNMMTAWFFATALAKQWEPSIKYIEEKKLDVWVHNKTIQKARESFRVTDEHKDYLKSLKRFG